MSPMEVMLFFFIGLAVFKAVVDSFEYWNRREEDHMPVHTTRARTSQRKRAAVTSIRPAKQPARMRRSA